MSDTLTMKTVLDFLTNLQKHNDRVWFEAHRKAYDAARDEFEALIAEVIQNLRKTSVMTRIAGETWQEADALKVKREEPYVTPRGK